MLNSVNTAKLGDANWHELIRVLIVPLHKQMPDGTSLQEISKGHGNIE